MKTWKSQRKPLTGGRSKRVSKYTDALVRQAIEDKQPVKCVCGKRIADRDGKYIYIYCKACKRTHKYELKN